MKLNHLAVALLVSLPALAHAEGRHMAFVGSLAPWSAGQYSNVVPDAARHVAYMGSFDDQGVAVIDTRDPANPILTDRLSTHITSDVLISDSADLDHVGHRLAVSHQRLTRAGGFEGISIYDTGADPYHPSLLRRIEIPGGVHTVQLDPEIESGRPYAYANSEGNWMMTIVNIDTGAILGQFASSEGIGCWPAPTFCVGFNFAHEGFVQRHPRSGRVLDYVSYWDSGLRIVDVTDPANPVEVGAFDYDRFTNGLTSAHYAAATPTADWVYLEDEIGYLQTGGVHVLDTSACDGTSYCTPTLVGEWHIKGHPVQAAGLNGVIHSGNFTPSVGAGFRRSFTYDAHNLDVRGEDELLIANYGMGIRLVDTSDKTTPVETSFYLPNGNMDDACKMDCGFTARQTWGAYFGTDGRIYASDLGRGFYVVDPDGSGGAARRAPAMQARAHALQAGVAAGTLGFRAVGAAIGGRPVFTFTLPQAARVRITIYDVRGRTIGIPVDSRLSSGPHSIPYAPELGGVRSLPRGLYFARLESSLGSATAKLVYLAR